MKRDRKDILIAGLCRLQFGRATKFGERGVRPLEPG
jgi:hypothetical protein